MYRSCDYFVESCVTPYPRSAIVACLNHLTCTYNLGRDWEWESTSLKAPKDEFGRPFQLLAYTKEPQPPRRSLLSGLQESELSSLISPCYGVCLLVSATASKDQL